MGDVSLERSERFAQGYFARCGVRGECVSDLLQEVRLRLHAAQQAGKPLTLAYVRTICDSVLADHHRACLRQPPCVALESCAEYAVVEMGYEAAENRLLLQQALEQLSERDRAIVQMHYLEEMPFEQIGGALGISSECAKKACQRAIAKLQRWAKEGGGGVEIAPIFPLPCPLSAKKLVN